jgi:hypothetical protein
MPGWGFSFLGTKGIILTISTSAVSSDVPVLTLDSLKAQIND